MTQTQRKQIWVVVRFPCLALESHLKSHLENHPHSQQQAIALHYKQRIYMANAEALAQGVTCHSSTTQAQALLPELLCLLRDPKLEQHAFAKLQKKLYGISPHLKPIYLEHQAYAEYSLALEVSGCLSLFGGWAQLLNKIDAILPPTTHQKLIACAHSESAAWLLTWHTQHNPYQLNFDLWQQQLKEISIHYLLPFSKLIPQLDSLGFTTLKDLWQQIQHGEKPEYAAIQKRFGKPFSQYLHSIFQSENHRVKPNYQPEYFFYEQLEFDYPVSNVEWLLPACQTLLQRLSDYLSKRQQCTQHITWHVQDINKNKQNFDIKTNRASSQWSLFLELSQIFFDQHGLPFAVDDLALECRYTQPLNAPPLDLFSGTQHSRDTGDIDKISSKITARLGAHNHYQLTALDDHLPERSQQKVPLLSKVNVPLEPAQAIRASWLFDKPIPLHSKQQRLFWHGYLTLLHGPERITGLWWLWPEERDYFLAMRDDFIRCWVFYERVRKEWYVHGVFA